MPLDLLDQDRFHKLARDTNGKVDQPLFTVCIGEPQVIADRARTIRFCFSDGSVDRAGDTIDQDGWELERFRRNPSALWAHDSSAPPIGRASNVAVTGSRLMGDIEFASAETYEFADTIYRLVSGGFIRAVSVGFRPLEYSFAEDDDRPWGIDFKRGSRPARASPPRGE